MPRGYPEELRERVRLAFETSVLTTNEIARQFKLNWRTVKRWAVQGAWRRLGDRVRRPLSAEDALAKHLMRVDDAWAEVDRQAAQVKLLEAAPRPAAKRIERERARHADLVAQAVKIGSAKPYLRGESPPSSAKAQTPAGGEDDDDLSVAEINALYEGLARALASLHAEPEGSDPGRPAGAEPPAS